MAGSYHRLTNTRRGLRIATLFAMIMGLGLVALSLNPGVLGVDSNPGATMVFLVGGMGIFFLGVSFGNFATALVNMFIEIPAVRDANGIIVTEASSKLGPVEYFWFFTILMVIVSVIYVVYAQFFYRGKSYIQGEDTSATHAEATAEGTDPR